MLYQKLRYEAKVGVPFQEDAYLQDALSISPRLHFKLLVEGCLATQQGWGTLDYTRLLLLLYYIYTLASTSNSWSRGAWQHSRDDEH